MGNGRARLSSIGEWHAELRSRSVWQLPGWQGARQRERSCPAAQAKVQAPPAAQMSRKLRLLSRIGADLRL